MTEINDETLPVGPEGAPIAVAAAALGQFVERRRAMRRDRTQQLGQPPSTAPRM